MSFYLNSKMCIFDIVYYDVITLIVIISIKHNMHTLKQNYVPSNVIFSMYTHCIIFNCFNITLNFFFNIMGIKSY